MVASNANSNDGLTPAQPRMMSPSQTAPHDAHLRLLGTEGGGCGGFQTIPTPGVNTTRTGVLLNTYKSNSLA